jgi:hypothetical protein
VFENRDVLVRIVGYAADGEFLAVDDSMLVRQVYGKS